MEESYRSGRGEPLAAPHGEEDTGTNSVVGRPDQPVISYDTSLTEAHLYLEESHVPLEVIQDEERHVRWEDISLPKGQGLLAIVRLPNVVAFPGETVPLRLLNSDMRALVHILLDTPSDVGPYHRWVNVQSFLRGSRTFGITSSSNVGCVVELRSIGSDANGEYCITMGCSRFEIVQDPCPAAAPLTAGPPMAALMAATLASSLA